MFFGDDAMGFPYLDDKGKVKIHWERGTIGKRIFFPVTTYHFGAGVKDIYGKDKGPYTRRLFLYFDRKGSKINDELGEIQTIDDFPMPPSYNLEVFKKIPDIGTLLHLLMSDRLVLEEPVQMTMTGVEGKCLRDLRAAQQGPLYSGIGA